MVKVMEEVRLTTIKPRNNVLLLAQEISFAKVLACNDKRLRDRGVRRLKKWFNLRSQGAMEFTKEDHMRIWKGLFYCMWMADKPLIQEELAEEISHLIHSFASFQASLLFVESFFASLSIEWFGIDQLRLDKFMMLVRRFMRQSLELVARLGWAELQVQQLADVYHRTLCSAPMGLSMHVVEVFCEELAKVGRGELSSATILQFLEVFVRFMATLKDGRLISQITRCVFLHLIRQTELGIEHQMKFSVWREYGFPGGDVDAAEKIEVESESEEEVMESGSDGEMEEERKEGVDARAGKVDVVLPPLDFDPQDLLKILKQVRNKKETTTKARKTLIQLISKYENLAAGKYPLGLHKVDLPSKRSRQDKKKEIFKVAKQLYIDERKEIDDDCNFESNESTVLLNKKTAKKKNIVKQKSTWEVSKSNESDLNGSGTNTSWEVSDSETNVEAKTTRTKKRKLDEIQQQPSDKLKKSKKTKLHSFSVSDNSKENSFSSPIASTPKNKNTNNVLKKSTSNNQNTPTEQNVHIPKEANKKKKKIPKLKKSQTSEVDVNNKLESLQDCSEKNTEDVSAKKMEITTNLQLNTSTKMDKNNGWGGDWDEPLQDGEYEIFIPNKKYVEKRKSLGLPYPVSSFVQNSAEKITPVNKLNKKLIRTVTPSSQKKVEFNLSANCSQDFHEYKQKVKSSKKQVPFDATKKPTQGLLKNSTPSPINPFYKKKLKFLKSPSDV